MKSSPDNDAVSALARLEDAVHLLRATPVRDHLVWLWGTGPFALSLLYFWADQSRSVTAPERLPVSAFGLAVVFLWARWMQSVYAARLHARLAGSTIAPGEGSTQSLPAMLVPLVAWQALALGLLPFALILVVPFPAFLAIQQGLIVTAHRAEGSPLRNLQLAVRQALYESRRTSREASLLSLVWLVLLINTGVLLYSLPRLAKLLLGVESPFTLNPATTLNTTFVAAVLVLATLLVDPLVKAVAVLRDFEMESRKTGADLLAGLRRIPLRTALGLLMLLGGVGPHSQVRAAEAASERIGPRAATVAPAALNRAITEVLESPEFTWREPRPNTVSTAEVSSRTLWQRWLERVGRFLSELGKRLEAPLKSIADWISRFMGNRVAPPTSPVKLDFSGFVEFLMWLLLLGGVAALTAVGIRLWHQRRMPNAEFAEPTRIVPDLEAEDVSAEQLPEEEWLTLAWELAERREHRPAVRALYLASLAGLAAQERLRLGRAKSNRDYEGEVRRKTRDAPQIAETFSEIVRVFERTWYGDRPVSSERFHDIAAAVQRLRAS